MQKPNTRPACGFQPVYHRRRKFVWDGNPPRAIKKGEFHVSAEVVADKMIAEAAELVEVMTAMGQQGR